MVAGYRPKYRIKKWWWPVYAWGIALTTVQGWRLRCKTTKSQQPYFQFFRELTAQLFAKYGSESKVGRPVQPQMIPRSIQDLDGANHLPTHSKLPNNKVIRRNCRYCIIIGKKNSKTTFYCVKYEVPCFTFLNATIYLYFLF
jgi:hypothetical protein